MDASIVTTWLKIAPSAAWSLVVVIGLMLWGPDWFKCGLGLETFITEYRNYLGVFFLLSLIGGLTPVWRIVGTEIREYQIARLGKKRLKNLTPDEKDILKGFIDQNTRTQNLSVGDGVVMGLTHEAIIYRSAPIGSPAPGTAYFDYNIQPWAWKFLQKNADLLD